MEQALYDHIVCGLKSQSIQKEMLTMADLTLKQTQETVLGMEMVAQQAAEINSLLVSAVKEVRITECWRCGGKHPPGDCVFFKQCRMFLVSPSRSYSKTVSIKKCLSSAV